MGLIMLQLELKIPNVEANQIIVQELAFIQSCNVNLINGGPILAGWWENE
jgi:hypothetical protein